MPAIPQEPRENESSETRRARAMMSDNIEWLQERAGRLRRRTQALRETVRSRTSIVEEAHRQLARSDATLDATLAQAHTNLQRLQNDHPFSSDAALEEMARENRRAARAFGRINTMPTPPLEGSPNVDSLFIPESRPHSNRGSHPLSNSWSADSPVDGLGDRNRSPTPADAWEIMHSTITPDTTLPSADSSFTSAVASQSFSASNNTNTTEPEHVSASASSNNSRHTSSNDSQSDSVSSIDIDDLPCDECDDDELLEDAEAYAENFYDVEMASREGRERILAHRRIRADEGNRFALAHESDCIDIGFRLIEEALNSDEGRQRLLQVGLLDGEEDITAFEDVVDSRRAVNRQGQIIGAHTRRAHVTAPRAPSPHPERYSEETRSAAREARAQVHEYFLRFAPADVRPRVLASPRSPPPQYEPLGSHPDVNAFTSRDGAVPHPVSPPTQRSQIEVADALLSGDETDLSAMRRVVERLARRDDVPEEWWMSMGLNMSRTRPRAPSPRRSEAAAGNRIRAGRIERGNSRL